MAANSGFVLDSSALIAMVAGEPGAEVVATALSEAIMSSVNLVECMTKLIQRGGRPDQVERVLRGLDVPIEPWTEALAWASRDLCALAWTKGLSVGDRACLTLARARRRVALTADRSWATLGLNVRVALIREGR